MKKQLILIAFIFCCCARIHAQNSAYHPGYYIDNNNNKVAGLIKNDDWDYNPTEFKYKTAESADPQTILIKDCKEFAVEEYKFSKFTVKIDKSSDSHEAASAVRASSFIEEVLLLRILTEGKAILYSYKSENLQRFFYSIDGSVMPLTYKIYYDNQTKEYRKNENYKQELLNSLKCDKMSQNDFYQLDYTANKLGALLLKYNNCSGSSAVEYKAKKNIKTVELFGKAGLAMSRFGLSEGGSVKDFGLKTKVKLGFEAEINMSNKAKAWSILVEPSYQYYKSSYKTNGTGGSPDLEIDYKAIDISVGLRKYMVLNNETFLFINAYGTCGFPSGSKVGDLKVYKTFNPALGIGCLYKNKYSLEIRYEFSRDILDNIATDSEYKSIGLLFGCKLL